MWLHKIWSWTISLLSNAKGFVEGEGEGGADTAEGTGTATADTSEGTGEEGGQKEGEGGTDEAGAEEGKEGEEDKGKGEGDTITEETLKLFGGDGELAKKYGGSPAAIAKAYRELEGKHKPMEMNQAAITKWAKGVGLKANYDADGNFKNFSIDEAKAKSTRERKFTDKHRDAVHKMFNTPDAGKSFVEAMSLLIQDLTGDAIGERERVAQEAMTFVGNQRSAWEYTKKVWPSLDPDQEGFPEEGSEHYNLARQIYNDNEDYQRQERGQLYAAAEAAAQLGIAPKKVAEAHKAGFKAGLGQKRILKKVAGPVSGPSARTAVKTGEPSMEDFINMKPSERAKHVEKQMSKKQGG